MVVNAMQGIRNVAEGNASRVQEMGIAVENLKFLAKDLQELVQQFKIINNEKDDGASIKEVFNL
jgi:methyl-accepting chemotaxis protein